MQDPAPAKRPRRGAAGQATQGPGVAGESARPRGKSRGRSATAMRRHGPASAAQDSTSKSRSRAAPPPPRRHRSPAPRPPPPPPPRRRPPPAAGASSTEAQLAEALARLELLVVAPFTAAREEAQTRRDEAVATFDAAAAAEKATLAARASEEKLIATLRRVLARALAGGGGEAPGLGWVCSALKAGCPCREGVRQKDAFPVDASWFRPNDAHAQAGRLFDEALQAYEEAVAAGRDDDAKAALLKLEGDKEATPELAALRKALCAACRALYAQRTANARARRGRPRAQGPHRHCASDARAASTATRDLVAAICSFQHTEDSEPKPPGAHGPGSDTAYPDIGHRVRDASKCDGWCLTCNVMDGIKEARAQSLRDRPLEERNPQGQLQYRRKHENYAYVFKTYKQGLKCHYCPLVCDEENQTGFCMCHTRDGAKHKFKEEGEKGMNGVCIVGRNWDFEEFKACADKENTLCHDYIACPTPQAVPLGPRPLSRRARAKSRRERRPRAARERVGLGPSPSTYDFDAA
ncbi:hypothetical protein JL720_15065 [Aureococcus anophagefferens]|nr:hypothetical protein JL720_15065 [Aureococcus anophagefferens]